MRLYEHYFLLDECFSCYLLEQTGASTCHFDAYIRDMHDDKPKSVIYFRSYKKEFCVSSIYY
ncbi:hypothetical protein MBAV_005046 [Candidatus Magnetobacterium bavaricum]|uniref:Uncharacterized protein n=1 Tax=Candidatus Magnetobacterium bavaricum TaxID=29290 RepID=A0A0F3GLD7_9BACT|nr:hypothetical protein MBAV_005046 [Candidatus Magnetobacterium bavaricum]